MRRSKYSNMFTKGQIVGEWQIVDPKIIIKERGRAMVKCLCLHCKTFTSLVSCHHLVRGRSTRCRACNYSIIGRGKDQNPHWMGAGEVPKTVLTHISNSAVRVHEPFTLTAAYVNSIYDGTCSVTSQPISISDSTAKLVKIDNSSGYVEGNVMWVHSSVAPVLKKTSKDEFINMCLQVAEQHQFKKE